MSSLKEKVWHGRGRRRTSSCGHALGEGAEVDVLVVPLMIFAVRSRSATMGKASCSFACWHAHTKLAIEGTERNTCVFSCREGLLGWGHLSPSVHAYLKCSPTDLPSRTTELRQLEAMRATKLTLRTGPGKAYASDGS